MEWHINELSLAGQFSSPEEFRVALEALLKLRNKEPCLKDRLYCSRQFQACQVTATHNFAQAVRALNDRTYTSLVLGWVAKAGPFWTDEDKRMSNEDDYFECETIDVTDQGLGEAARRKIKAVDARCFSFQGAFDSCVNSPILVIHGLPEDPIRTVEIVNCWQTSQIADSIQAQKEYRNWTDVEVEARARFTLLKISDDAMEPLHPVPFSQLVTHRIFELLEVLNRLVAETNEKGALSPTGKTLYSEHFTGGKAWFTDESSTNKNDRRFKERMTFKDPENENQSIFCSWHGKIKTPQLRIHFQWPLPNGESIIKVVYIGPKITKR